jgi:hypothetical protein
MVGSSRRTTPSATVDALCYGVWWTTQGRLNAMADAPEKAALELKEFISAADERASGRTPEDMRSQPFSAPNGKPPILEMYEQCLRGLTHEELVEFDRITRKMHDALG